VATLDVEIAQLNQQLARETDPAEGELLFGRLTVLDRQKQALVLTVQNTRAAERAAGAQARAKAQREAARQKKGMSVPQIQARLAKIAQHIAAVEGELRGIHEAMNAVAAQGRREAPGLPTELVREGHHGQAARAHRDGAEARMFALTREQKALEALLDPAGEA
jgi:seryl-tRNA synthetase